MNKIFAAVFGLLFFIFSTCSAYSPAGKVYVTMLDVGQGDSFLIETPTQNILIDTGGVEARQALVNQLNARGITRLEKVILTHPHADHIGGVRAVLNNFTVDTIYDNGYYSSSSLYTDYRKANVNFMTLAEDDVLSFGNSQFLVLNPDDSAGVSINDRSIVGRLVFGNFSMLFTGDITRDAEIRIANEHAQALKSTILKAAHHGSKTSSCDDFLYLAAPSYVFISASKNNPFGHPHLQPLRNYRTEYVTTSHIYCTAFNGSVFVETDGSTWSITPSIVNDWVESYTGESITVTRLI